MEDLGIFPGSYPSSIARGRNERGQVVGWSGSNPSTALIYIDGLGMVPLPAPAAYPWGCFAEDINDAGAVAGTCGLSPVHAVKWNSNRAVKDLGDLGATLSSWDALNAAGPVDGQTGVQDQFLQQAFLYTDGGGMVDIMPGNGLYAAEDINDRPGGSQITGAENSVAFRWENGVLTSLDAPDGYAYSFGMGMNDARTVVGAAKRLQGETSYYARYTDGRGWGILGGLGQHDTMWAVNNAGVVVGTGKSPQSGRIAGMISTSVDGLQDLSTLITTPETWSIAEAYDINDAGQIAARGCCGLRASSTWYGLRRSTTQPALADASAQ